MSLFNSKIHSALWRNAHSIPTLFPPANPRFFFFRGYQLPAALEVATQTISETTTAIGRLDRLTKEVSQRVEDKPTFA